MICPACKETIDDNSIYCEHCGSKVSGAAADLALNTGSAKQPALSGPLLKKYKNPKILIGGACVIAAIILVVVFAATRKKSINLKEYVTVEFYGYDSVGRAEVIFDYEKFALELAKALKLPELSKDEELSEILDAVSDYGISAAHSQYFSYGLDVDNGLSNGDAVELAFTYNNDDVKKYGIQFTGDKIIYNVSGLETIREIDPFADIEVVFSGISPGAGVDYVNHSSDTLVKNLNYEFDKYEDIAKGETITLNVVLNEDEESFTENYGCRLETVSKQYTCDKVDEYIVSADNIPKDLMSNMKSQTEDNINAYFAQNSAFMTAGNVTYEGGYFLSNKYNDDDYLNMVYIIYSAKVKSTDGSFETSKVYLPVRFTNLICYMDGTGYVDLSGTEISGATTLEYDWWKYVKGYTKLAALKNELVTSRKSTFYVEALDGIEGDGLQNENAGTGNIDNTDNLEGDEYILPNSNSAYLTMSDLEGLTKEQCRLARNEIYARRGRIFDDEELKAYFEGKSWYEGSIKAKDFEESMLNKYETANRDLIAQYEAEQGF